MYWKLCLSRCEIETLELIRGMLGGVGSCTEDRGGGRQVIGVTRISGISLFEPFGSEVSDSRSRGLIRLSSESSLTTNVRMSAKTKTEAKVAVLKGQEGITIVMIKYLKLKTI